jgi:peptidoglycan/LPS O-acetylase OafA/YrhL
MIPALTGVRGAAALWVVLYHYDPALLVLLPGWRHLGPLIRVGDNAVDLFFVLSGFVLAYNYSTEFTTVSRWRYLRFLYMRLARVYPVHLCTLLAVVPIVLLARAAHRPITDAGYTWQGFVANLALAHAWSPALQLTWNYPSWSISTEWFAYLLFPLICLYANRLRTPRASIVGALLTLLVAQAFKIYPHVLPWRELLRCVGEFALGCLLLSVVRNETRRANFALEVLALVCGAAMLISPFVGFATGPVLLALFAGLIYGLGSRRAGWLGFFSTPSWVYMGELSYPLYMTHAVVQKILYGVLPAQRFANLSMAWRLAILCVYTVSLATTAILTLHLIERPARAWLRRIIDQH